MKITKSQLKQIIKEELSKVLNEGPADVPEPGLESRNFDTMPAREVLTQMIYADPNRYRSEYDTETDLKKIQKYIEWLASNSADFDKAISVIGALQNGLPTRRGFPDGETEFYLPAALGFEKNQEFGIREKEWKNLELGDPHDAFDHKNWVKSLSKKLLFRNIIHQFTHSSDAESEWMGHYRY